MDATQARASRPRRYDLHPVPGFGNRDAAYAVAALDELSERLLDLISDLSQEALDYVPDGGNNSIGMLVVHMAWAEASWVSQVTHTPIPLGLQGQLQPGQQGESGELLPFSASGASLVGLCRRVRRELTVPALSPLLDIDTEVLGGQRSMTVRGVLVHLVWHWTYHSGQVGLLRRLSASRRYRWTFSDRVGAPGGSNPRTP